MADFVGFGALNVDYCYEVSSHFFGSIRPGVESEGRSDSLDGLFKRLNTNEKLLFKSGGGSAANTTVALTRMGFSTGYLGKIGNDEEGRFLLSTLTGVDTSEILKGNTRSGIVLALQTQNNSDSALFIFPGDNDTIRPEEINYGYVNQSKVLHFTSFLGEQSFNTQIETLSKVDPRIFVSFDGGELYARRGVNALKPFLKRSNIIFPSREECKLLTESDDYIKGAKELLSYGPQIVCVTLDKDGCFIVTKDETFLSPSFFVPEEKIEHTIGAGDVFASGFLALYMSGETDLGRCASFANKIAAKMITGRGREHYPTKVDLLAYTRSSHTGYQPF